MYEYLHQVYFSILFKLAYGKLEIALNRIFCTVKSDTKMKIEYYVNVEESSLGKFLASGEYVRRGRKSKHTNIYTIRECIFRYQCLKYYSEKISHTEFSI